jgi:hypothetical protein
LEGGFVEFKDLSKITGYDKYLASLGKSFQVLEEYRKTVFCHLFDILEILIMLEMFHPVTSGRDT